MHERMWSRKIISDINEGMAKSPDHHFDLDERRTSKEQWGSREEAVVWGWEEENLPSENLSSLPILNELGVGRDDYR